MTVQLSQNQMKALTSSENQCVYVAGIGSGKSFLLGAFLLEQSALVGSVGMLTAPVYDTLNNSTLPAVQKMWAMCGIYESEHYIIGSRPPESWGVPSYTHRNSKVLTWRWGSYTIIDGSDNYNKHRGLELDYVAIDELRDIKDGALEVYQGRLRGNAKKQKGAQYRILAVTSPPDDPTTIDELRSTSEIVQGTSYDNSNNLPIGYLERLKAQYDEITYRREVLGELIYNGGQTAYSAFTDANIIQTAFNPSADTVIAWDFNSDAKKPMATVILQSVGSEWHVVQEFISKNTNTTQQAEAIDDYLQANGFVGNLLVTGDYSGHRKESSATRSDYAIIESFLGNYRNYRLMTRPTLTIRDRVASTNALFNSYAGHQTLFVDHNCKLLIEDLRKTMWLSNGRGLDDTKPERTHPTDALSYFAYNLFPIDRKQFATRVA